MDTKDTRNLSLNTSGETYKLFLELDFYIYSVDLAKGWVCKGGRAMANQCAASDGCAMSDGCTMADECTRVGVQIQACKGGHATMGGCTKVHVQR